MRITRPSSLLIGLFGLLLSFGTVAWFTSGSCPSAKRVSAERSPCPMSQHGSPSMVMEAANGDAVPFHHP